MWKVYSVYLLVLSNTVHTFQDGRKILEGDPKQEKTKKIISLTVVGKGPEMIADDTNSKDIYHEFIPPGPNNTGKYYLGVMERLLQRATKWGLNIRN